MIHWRTMLITFVVALYAPATISAEQPRGSTFAEREFLGLVLGKTTDEVTTAIGEPNRTEMDNVTAIWYYEDLVQAMTSRKVFPLTQLTFSKGRVFEVMNTFGSPSTLPD